MDLDDLLEDVPDQVETKKKTLNRAKTAMPKLKQKDDDDWGEMGLEDENDIKSTGGFGANTQNSGRFGLQKQSSFGFGGENGLRKEKPTKKEAEEEDEWGLDLDSKHQKGGNFGSRLLGRKSLPKEEDDLDNFLDDME